MQNTLVKSDPHRPTGWKTEPVPARRIDALKFFGSIAVAIPFLYLCTGHTVQLLQRIQAAPADPSPPQEEAAGKPVAAPFSPPFSPALETLLLAAVAASAAAAAAAPGRATHVLFALATLYAYVLAARFPRLLTPAAARHCHPLLLSAACTSALLAAFAAVTRQPYFAVLRAYFVPGGPPTRAAGNFMLFWLEPAIITFAFGLHARRRLLLANALPILGGSLASTVGGILTMALLGRAAGAPRAVRLALLPRATAALAVVQAAILGASTSLTAVNACFTGISCANFGPALLTALGVRDPVARGVAQGGGGWALAAAGMISADPAAFPFAPLAMALTSAMATVLFCVPPFAAAAFAVAGV